MSLQEFVIFLNGMSGQNPDECTAYGTNFRKTFPGFLRDNISIWIGLRTVYL